MDQVVISIKSRFADHEKLYQDFAVLDPRRFNECGKIGLRQNTFEFTGQNLGKHVDPIKLREQLLEFYHSFPKLVKTLPEALRSADVFCFRNAWSLNEHLQKISIFMSNQAKNEVMSIAKR